MDTRRPVVWAAAIVALCLIVLAVVLLRDESVEVTPPPSTPVVSPTPTETPDPAEVASALVEDLEVRLTNEKADAGRLAARGDAEARALLAAVERNVASIGMASLDLRYVDQRTAAEDETGTEDAVIVDAELSWRIAGIDRRTNRTEVSLVVTDSAGKPRFLDIGGHDNATPLWLLEPLAVDRGPRTLVMVADRSSLPRFADMAREAVSDVAAVLPRWRRSAVVLVPSSPAVLGQVLDESKPAYDAIAAITTTADGSVDPAASTRILVNPEVFGGLDERGAQIVMSHEATHLATGAATSGMPMWLLEGFADYVALKDVELPVSVTASQILAEVRRNGPPQDLPGSENFDPRNEALGTSYEAAWLAARLIADRHGEDRLVRLYRAVDAGRPVERAFPQILGRDFRGFVAEWRQHLRDLADDA